MHFLPDAIAAPAQYAILLKLRFDAADNNVMTSEPEHHPNSLTKNDTSDGSNGSRDAAAPGWHPNPVNANETLYWTGKAWYTSEPGWHPNPQNPNEERYWRGRSWHYVTRPAWASSMTQTGAPVAKAIMTVMMGVGIPFILWMAYQALPDSPQDAAVIAAGALFLAYAGRQAFTRVDASVDARDASPEVQARHRNKAIQHQIARHKGWLWYSSHSTSGWEDTGCSPGVQCNCRARKNSQLECKFRKAPKYGAYAGLGLAAGGAWLIVNDEFVVGVVFMLASAPLILFADIAHRKNREKDWSVKKSWNNPI
jgi:hypothetical protein